MQEYDVLMNIRSDNYNQSDVLAFIREGGTWIGELNSNVYPIENWNIISGTVVNSTDCGSQSVHIQEPSHFLAQTIDWNNIPVGSHPCECMIDLRNINDPGANNIVSVMHSSFGENPLLVEKAYVNGMILLFNWDYRDNPSYGNVENMLHQLVFYGHRNKIDLDFTSSNATIPAMSQQQISLTIDTVNTYDGTYYAPIIIHSNDPVTSSLEIPLTITVTGIPDMAITPVNMEFADEFVGYSASQNIQIKNTGTDVLTIENIITDLDVYSVEYAYSQMAPATHQLITVTFEPLAEQAYTGHV
ncbi:MAG: hypothetical protein OMM_11431, partial [Candidatus Magnetoglobus multicellularis str. Araruama]